MARRGGKASSRRSRQRQAQRGQRPAPGAPPRQPLAPPTEAVAEELEVPVASGDAFEKADAEVRAQASGRAPLSAGTRAKRGPAARFGTTGPSRLTERAAAEYHYVIRDLRNIGVLVLIIAALLATATIVVNMLGIGKV